jgi:hypothetical protein
VTESVNSNGLYSNPTAFSITTPFRVLMCRPILFLSMPAHTLPSTALLSHLHFLVSAARSSHPPVSACPVTKGPGFCLRPRFFLFYTTHFWGHLKGVTSSLLLQLNEDFSLPSHFSFLTERDCCHACGYAFLHFFRLAECDSESLVNYFLGHLRDSVPSARRDWLPTRFASSRTFS